MPTPIRPGFPPCPHPRRYSVVRFPYALIRHSSMSSDAGRHCAWSRLPALLTLRGYEPWDGNPEGCLIAQTVFRLRETRLSYSIRGGTKRKPQTSPRSMRLDPGHLAIDRPLRFRDVVPGKVRNLRIPGCPENRPLRGVGE